MLVPMATEPLTVPPPERPVESYRGIEVRSIDWVPDSERHGKLWHQLPLWFLGNFQYFSIPIGFVGPSLGLSLGWSIVAGAAGILIGTVFMAFHATQGPTLGLPQMIQSRARSGTKAGSSRCSPPLLTTSRSTAPTRGLCPKAWTGPSGGNPA